MNTNWDKIRKFLDDAIAELNAKVDNPPVTIALLAGLTLARVWVTELEPGRDWATLKKRLETAKQSLVDMRDAGHPTNFGLWDGVTAAASAVNRIEEGAHA